MTLHLRSRGPAEATLLESPPGHGLTATSRLRAIAISLALGVGACALDAPPVWDTAGAPKRAELAESGFQELGQGRFTILSFSAAAESTRVLEDDFHARTLLYRVPFKARIRFVRDVEVPELPRIHERIGESGWLPERHRDAVILTLALGPGARREGSEEDLDAAAVFEDLEPGWRLRAFEGNR